MDTAKRLDCADEYIPLNRQDAKAQWAKIKADNPCEWWFSGCTVDDVEFQTALMWSPNAPASNPSSTTQSTMSHEVGPSWSTESMPMLLASRGPQLEFSSTRFASLDHLPRRFASPVLSLCWIREKSGWMEWSRMFIRWKTTRALWTSSPRGALSRSP